MLGTWEWRLVRGDIRQCVDLAGEGMRLADGLADPGILMEALFMPGVTMFYRAEFAEARRYSRARWRPTTTATARSSGPRSRATTPA